MMWDLGGGGKHHVWALMLTLTNLSNRQRNKALWRQKSCSPLQNGSKPEQMVLPQPAGASQTLQKNDRSKSGLIIPYSNWSWEVNGLSAEEMVGWLWMVFLYNKHPESIVILDDAWAVALKYPQPAWKITYLTQLPMVANWKKILAMKLNFTLFFINK